MSNIAKQLPADVFDHIAMNAGILLSKFDVSTWTVAKENIIGATSGGIAFKDAPSYKDFGEDIDNCPANTKQLKQIESREVTASGTFVSIDVKNTLRLIGAANSATSTTPAYTSITPTDTLSESHFMDELWFLCDYGNGGAIAIKMMNALNADGFNIQSSDDDKAKFSFNFMAHYDMDDSDTVPYVVYIKEGTAE